jgi:hypothetical protein
LIYIKFDKKSSWATFGSIFRGHCAIFFQKTSGHPVFHPSQKIQFCFLALDCWRLPIRTSPNYNDGLAKKDDFRGITAKNVDQK